MSMFRGTLGTMTDEIETISEDEYDRHASSSVGRTIDTATEPDFVNDLRAEHFTDNQEEKRYDEAGNPLP
jgi:hypothetical protein